MKKFKKNLYLISLMLLFFLNVIPVNASEKCEKAWIRCRTAYSIFDPFGLGEVNCLVGYIWCEKYIGK